MHFLLLAAETTAKTSFFYENWPIIKQLIWLFGKFMSGIMYVLDNMNIYSIALCIVIFTIVTKVLLTPLTVKQQKSTRMTNYIQPELQEIQKKYRGRTDQASQQAMLAEQQALQEKYGVSMFAGCLPMLIQMPILFSLYPVIYNMDKYVDYLAVIKSKLSDDQLTKMFTLFGIDLEAAPGWKLSLALIIPILVVVTQFVSTKLMTASQPGRENAPGGNSMKIMNTVMPLMLGVMAVSFPAFLGLYWATQSAVMAVQQLIINKIIYKKPIEEVIKENMEKANAKRKKKGLPELSEKASMSTRNLRSTSTSGNTSGMSAKEKEEAVQKAKEYYSNRSSNPNSLAAKARMVQDYNDRNKKN
ncbi:MAG: YidC/Oxa1 family membrane protein insertase [Lachnospiraceae bacterium]|nr:YidC/Oxa1 family membrane protein insertase [Lachnospiraceae bacterium]